MEKDSTKYCLNFYDALRLMLENDAWIKGNKFASGYYMQISKANGSLVLVDANHLYTDSILLSIKSLQNQMFRVITVATLKELSK